MVSVACPRCGYPYALERFGRCRCLSCGCRYPRRSDPSGPLRHVGALGSDVVDDDTADEDDTASLEW